jgi:Cu/Ag efflux protein CusF
VNSESDIDKNGEATISDIKVGDAVTFSTTTANGQTVIDKLHAGNEALDRPPGGHGDGLDQSGTVTAVTSNSVTIKTSTGTKTYTVNSESDIDKNGEATISDIKVGDAVTFSTTTANGQTVIDKLHAGNEALDRPPGGHG